MISRCWEEARATLERQTWQDQWLANSPDFCYTDCVLLLVSFLETCVRMCQIFSCLNWTPPRNAVQDNLYMWSLWVSWSLIRTRIGYTMTKTHPTRNLSQRWSTDNTGWSIMFSGSFDKIWFVITWSLFFVDLWTILVCVRWFFVHFLRASGPFRPDHLCSGASWGAKQITTHSLGRYHPVVVCIFEKKDVCRWSLISIRGFFMIFFDSASHVSLEYTSHLRCFQMVSERADHWTGSHVSILCFCLSSTASQLLNSQPQAQPMSNIIQDHSTSFNHISYIIY